MKPHRLKLAHNLLLTYGLYRKMECYRPRLAQADDMLLFHTEEYTRFLQRVSPLLEKKSIQQTNRFNVGEFTDCPLFDGLFDFCKMYVWFFSRLSLSIRDGDMTNNNNTGIRGHLWVQLWNSITVLLIYASIGPVDCITRRNQKRRVSVTSTILCWRSWNF